MTVTRGSYDFIPIKNVNDNLQDEIRERSHLETNYNSTANLLSSVNDVIQNIENGYVRWDASTNKLYKVVKHSGEEEIVQDILTGWMRFGMENDNPTLSLGDNNNMTVRLTPEKLSFYDGQYEVAYISGQRLYINQTVVINQMDVGRSANETDPSTGQAGLGQWSWKVHSVNNKNNLYLKWLG